MAHENFTLYTEVDPNNRFIITSTKVTWAGLTANEDAYVYKDFGIDYFDADYHHLINTKITSSGSAGRATVWLLSNEIEDRTDIIYNSGDYHGVYWAVVSGQLRLYLSELDSGITYSNYLVLSYNTDYYLKIKRVESEGTYGKIYCYIYSDINRTILIDTLSVTLHEKANFRYLYCGQSANNGNSSAINGYSENLYIVETNQKTLTSDAHIKSLDIQKTLTSDAYVYIPDIQKTLTSDAYIVIEETYDINNKINTIKQSLNNINNKINTVKRTFKNINNYINTVKLSLSNINNDFRTKKEQIYNINNDIRFLKSWQIPGDAGFQSLGKTYIKVYISSIEQTDVDIDSIRINKYLSTYNTASFKLGRAYDSSKPTIESLVEIKYDDWTLYKGYITSISPTDNPESILISCKDKFWKQNKSNKYFHVGHNPSDDKELYYSTIKEALLTEYSWDLDIGDFVPQTIDCFAKGESDIITELIQSAGNYEWYYNVNEEKKLWTAGYGEIIEIERQTLNANLGLHDLISHRFEDDVTNIVNKYRVQMGNISVRKFSDTGGTRTYEAHDYSSYSNFLEPDWDSSYEILAKDSLSGYGWDYHTPEDSELYRDVFKKYSLPYLDTSLSSWSDRYPPYIEVYSPWSIYGFPSDIITEGFTIDYENKKVIFTEPAFMYQTNDYGEISAVRAPSLKIYIWKENFYTYTSDPSDDPESDISNPLMFFTDKMGDYSDTVIKDLNLSDLSIQEGAKRVNLDGTIEIIPSWDDTEFAEDYANWQLSKICDKRINGEIEITLDALLFYNIQLNNRIEIDGITESAMNILSIDYDLSNFTVRIRLENSRAYKRTVSLMARGE